MEQRGSVVIYRTFMEAMDSVPERSYKRIMNAVLHYAMDGIEPKLSGLELSVFLSIKGQIDANNRKFENGKQGGRPRNQDGENENQTETKEEPNNNQDETKEEPNENQTETKPNLTRARMRNEKGEMRNEKEIVSKKVSNLKEKENNARAYDKVLDEFGVQGEYREAIFRFIKHLKVNFNTVMMNDRLENLIIRLDMTFSHGENERYKINYLDEAIRKGYKWLEVEETETAL